ncbi:hypothetical protein NL452_27615, partial [Klebsiella pneumoniae]|nr:hypothetical protein [Klebsiella pneumoniae]
EEAELVHDQAEDGRLEISTDATGVIRVVPHLRYGMGHDVDARVLRELLDGYVANLGAPIRRCYYTPMMLPISRHLEA